MTNSINGERQSAFGSAYKYQFLGKKNAKHDDGGNNGDSAGHDEIGYSLNSHHDQTKNSNPDDLAITKESPRKRRGTILNALI